MRLWLLQPNLAKADNPIRQRTIMTMKKKDIQINYYCSTIIEIYNISIIYL